MAHINLLPWRAELRKERETRFVAVMGIALALCGVIFFGVYTYVDGLISYQKERNAFLDQKIKEAKEKIKEIKELEKKRESLYKRMEVIQKLQTSRPEVVHLFNEIARTLPQGVYFESLIQKKRKVTIQGVAQSDARVSTLMRNLDESVWLGQTELKVVQSDQQAKERRKNKKFNISLKQETPKKEGEADKNAEEESGF